MVGETVNWAVTCCPLYSATRQLVVSCFVCCLIGYIFRRDFCMFVAHKSLVTWLCVLCCVDGHAGPVRNGDLFDITFSSDNSINSTGFYATYHVINASMMTSPPGQPITGKCRCWREESYLAMCAAHLSWNHLKYCRNIFFVITVEASLATPMNLYYDCFMYINLYSPTSGSKRKKHTYKHINTVKSNKKQKKKTASKCRLHVIMLLHAIIQ